MNFKAIMELYTHNIIMYCGSVEVGVAGEMSYCVVFFLIL